MTNEDLELAELHVQMAEDIILEESKKSGKSEEKFRSAEFALEKAESEISELKEEN